MPFDKTVQNLERNIGTPGVSLLEDGDYRSAPSVDESRAPLDWVYCVRLLAEKRRGLYKTAVWTLAASIVLALLIPKRYESTATIMPPNSLGGVEGMMMAALVGKASSPPPGLAALAGNMLGMKSTGALFVDLLGSRTVEDDIVEQFDLQRVYRERYRQDARKILRERTEVSEDRKSGIITIVVTDRNPQRAQGMAHAYVEELNRLMSRVSTSSARRERIFIEERMVSVKGDLEDAEKQFSEFASKNTALDIKEQAKAMVEAGAVLQGQLIAAQSELEGLQQIYSASNVRVRAARARVDELKNQLQKIAGTDASLSSDDPTPGELYPPIRKLPLLGVQWADLYRRMKIQETVFELLNQQYELARIQEAKEIPTVSVIDPPNLPEKKSYPPRLLVTLLLTVLALLCTAAHVLGVDRWQRVDPRDPRKVFVTRISERLREWLQSARVRLHIGPAPLGVHSRGQSDG